MAQNERDADREPTAALRNLQAHALAHLDVARADGDKQREKGARELVADVESLRFGILEASVRYNPVEKTCTGDGEAFCACPTTLEREALAQALVDYLCDPFPAPLPDDDDRAFADFLIARGVRLIAPPEYEPAPTEGLHA